jgi:gliding motility-associated-like protein
MCAWLYSKLSLGLIIFLATTINSKSVAQNVVRNGGFSDVTDPALCYVWWSAFLLPGDFDVLHWYSPINDTGTNYYGGGWLSHQCMNPYIIQTNQAKPCHQPMPCPKQGLGIAMLSLRKNNILNSVVHRGFIAQQLPDTLTAGATYQVEFYARPFKWSYFFTKNVGLLFTADSMQFDHYMQNPGPHIETPVALTDTSVWTRVSGTYVANGTERYLNIGNFWHDTATVLTRTFFPVPPSFVLFKLPWYLIDAVQVYKATDTVYSISLPKDTLLCPNQTLALHPQRQGFLLEDTLTTYLWSTGSTDSTITVTQPGTYWVQTTINQRFVAVDTIVVDYFPANYTLSLPDTVTFCEGTEAVIQAATLPAQYATLTAYLWNTGSTLTGIQVRNPGLYWLNAQTPCYPLADSTWALQDFCETYLWVPNAFTPDGDGTNDFFAFQGAPAPVKLSIYDRWGTRVFYSPNYQNDWDGTYQGQPLPGGVYTYLIEYTYINPNATHPTPSGSQRQVQGKVTILR